MSLEFPLNSQFRHINMKVQWRLKNCLQLAEQFFDYPFVMPTLNYQLTGQKAGVAYLQRNEIRLNRTLLLENPIDFIQQVVPHELAHIIVFQQFGHVKPHGKEWKFVMENIFQQPAHIYHQFDLSNVRKNTFTYQCACQTHHLSATRHNKIQQKGAQYFCRQCKQTLQITTKLLSN